MRLGVLIIAALPPCNSGLSDVCCSKSIHSILSSFISFIAELNSFVSFGIKLFGCVMKVKNCAVAFQSYLWLMLLSLCRISVCVIEMETGMSGASLL